MTDILIWKMKFLLNEKNRLENKLVRTFNIFSMKRDILGEFITEINKDIEILECDISNLRNRLIYLGLNPDVKLEEKNSEDIGREYDLLLDIGYRLAPDLGPLGIQYEIDDKKEMLALALLDMLYLKSDNMIRIDSRKIKRRRI